MESTPGPSSSLQSAIQQFLTYLVARNLSQNTIRAYRRDLAQLVNSVAANATASDVDRNAVRSFLVKLHQDGIGRSSVYRKLEAIKSFYRWADNEGISFDGRILNLSTPRERDKLPNVPSEKEMERLLDGKILTACPERDRVILELLYGSGLRASELAGVNLADFKYKDALLIRGKGKKERMVPLTEPTQIAVEAWLPIREQLLIKFTLKTDALLFSVGPLRSLERLDVRSIHRIVRGVAMAKGLRNYHPHMLRHACGTHLHDHDVPLLAIARLLGHSKLATTQIYTRVSTGRMLDVYLKAHPHARKSGF